MSQRGSWPSFLGATMFEQEATIQKVKELIEPLLRSRKAELVEAHYRFEGRGIMLRLLVDTAVGITIDDLAFLNQAIGALLDEHDVIPEHYTLEVSSPGLDRPLKTGIDFERVIGRRIKIYLSSAVNGQQEQVGKVLSASEEAVVIETDRGEKLKIPLAKIAKARQEIEI